MRNLLALVGLVVVRFIGAGWYLGWYKVGVESNNPSHPKFGVEIETDKIKQDLKQGAKSVGKEVQGYLTSQPVNPGELPPLPPPPPIFNPGDVSNPVPIPAPPNFAPGR